MNDKVSEARSLLYDHFHATMSEQEFDAMLAALVVRSESTRRDTERLDWLEGMVVEVRSPLQWGSRQLFIANPVAVEGMDDDPSNIRAQIDYQQKGGTKP